MRKHSRNITQAVAALTVLFASSPAWAGVWVGGGVEYMTWGEYYDTSGSYKSSNLLQETGMRPFVEANAQFNLTERTSVVGMAHAYAGSVDYDGQKQTITQSGVTFSPYKTTTDYKGIRAEGGFAFMPLPHGEYKELAFIMTGGLEAWNREIQGPIGYTEEYKMPFLRLGAEMEAPDTGGWNARGGFIIPFNAQEHVRIMDGVSLRPDARPTFYLGIGRRFGRFVEAGFNYSQLRFEASEYSAQVTWNGVPQTFPDGSPLVVFQPRTEVDIYQIYAKIGF